jgi:hypothetical protein
LDSETPPNRLLTLGGGGKQRSFDKRGKGDTSCGQDTFATDSRTPYT